MEKPLISCVSYNRCGITANNLKNLLATTEDDFDLYITDNGSTDGIWDFIQTIKDDRIKHIKHFDKNYGGIYATNYALSHRTKYQPFIVLDNDVFIKDPHWIKKLYQATVDFPDVGFIGATRKSYLDQKFTNLTLSKSNISTCYYCNFIVGCCSYAIPELLDILGYYNEECCGGDSEICRRINFFTPYKTAYIGEFLIDYKFSAICSQCAASNLCKYNLTIPNNTCFDVYESIRVNGPFGHTAVRQSNKYIQDIQDGKANLYSPSIHDKESLKKSPYNYEAAQKNFDFFSNFTSLDL